MRTNYLLTSLIVVGLGAGWVILRSTETQLQAQVDLVRSEHRDLLSLEAERNRLAAQQPSAAQLAALHTALAERQRLLGEISTRKSAPPAGSLPVGEWIASDAWQNRGRNTPCAAVETALWAAAGGDVAALEAALELDDDARTKAAALLDRLSPAARNTYATPDSLIASVTMKSIPLAEAQLVWFHTTDQDHAAVGVLLNDPHSSATPVNGADALFGEPPPALPPNRGTRLATLTLHRSESGWRLVVPAQAIDQIARELAPAPSN